VTIDDELLAAENLSLRPVTDKRPIAALMTKYWGSPRMLVGMHTYDVTVIDAHGLFDPAGNLVAFASWTMRDKNMMLCALHAVTEGRGIASHMLECVKDLAREQGARNIRAMVSNDNMPALIFYQKCGFRFSTLYVGAVDAYRGQMPGLIKNGYLGIPVHDALELEFAL